ncbi:hypothetical protein BD414DRAFT_305804 [Trametes punicea]|nr:hypothetical protein BD414DRAFT_305804 [Trametes punicea]
MPWMSDCLSSVASLVRVERVVVIPLSHIHHPFAPYSVMQCFLASSLHDIHLTILHASSRLLKSNIVAVYILLSPLLPFWRRCFHHIVVLRLYAPRAPILSLMPPFHFFLSLVSFSSPPLLLLVINTIDIVLVRVASRICLVVTVAGSLFPLSSTSSVPDVSAFGVLRGRAGRERAPRLVRLGGSLDGGDMLERAGVGGVWFGGRRRCGCGCGCRGGFAASWSLWSFSRAPR